MEFPARAPDLATPHDLSPLRDLLPPADLRPPPDLAPPAPHGPLGAIEQAPAWARQDLSNWAAENTWRRAAPVQADVLRDARVICYISAKTSFDLFKGADFSTLAYIGAGPRIEHRGENDKNSTQVLIPVSELHTGDEITLHVVDRDFWTTEWAGSLRAPYSGRFPQIIEGNTLSAECRVMTREQGEKQLPALVAALNTAMAKTRLGVVPQKPDFGRIDSGIPEALIALSQIAAFVGWQHPVVKERAAFVEKRLNAWDEACAATLRRITEHLPRAGETVEIQDFGRVRALPSRCEKPAPGALIPSDERTAFEFYGCVLQLEFTPARPMLLEEFYCRKGEYKGSTCWKRWRLVRDDGRTAEPRPISLRNTKDSAVSNAQMLSKLAAGTTYVLTVSPQIPVAVPPARNRPVLIEGQFGMLRMD